jgi:Spy/CpxP family protein refolding chaperone
MTTNPMSLSWRRALAPRALAPLLALAALLAPAAGARPRHSPAEHVARHAGQLGLDAEAQATLATIVEESRTRDETLHQEIRAARERMHELLSAPDLDRDAVMAQADALDALHARAHRNRLESMLRIHELLTPAQRAALVEIRERERPWRRGRGPLGRCSADLRSLCADAPDGAGALRCLADRWDAVSEPCREGVARGQGRDEDPPPPPD